MTVNSLGFQNHFSVFPVDFPMRGFRWKPNFMKYRLGAFFSVDCVRVDPIFHSNASEAQQLITLSGFGIGLPSDDATAKTTEERKQSKS